MEKGQKLKRTLDNQSLDNQSLDNQSKYFNVPCSVSTRLVGTSHRQDTELASTAQSTANQPYIYWQGVRCLLSQQPTHDQPNVHAIHVFMLINLMSTTHVKIPLFKASTSSSHAIFSRIQGLAFTYSSARATNFFTSVHSNRN